MLSVCRYDIQERTRSYCGQGEKVLPIPLKRLVFMPAVAILIAACGDSHPAGQATVTSSATFSRIQLEIFTPSCAITNCHDTNSHQSGLNLSAGNAYVQIVNIAAAEAPALKRVAPNNPNNSYLFQKINGTASVGPQMPLGAAPLGSDQINLVRDWILSGAPNN
jgi:hypothetical protein